MMADMPLVMYNAFQISWILNLSQHSVPGRFAAPQRRLVACPLGYLDLELHVQCWWNSSSAAEWGPICLQAANSFANNGKKARRGDWWKA